MPSTSVSDNLARVLDQIRETAERCGRAPGEIRLVGVSKYVDAAVTRELFEAGCQDLGESRPQQLWDKAELLDDLPIRWHLIGHLQRNKVKRTLACQPLLHSIDSERLADAIQQAAEQLEGEVRGLLEVNTSGEQAKHGAAPDETERLLEAIEQRCPRLSIIGLMTMSARDGGPAGAKRNFETLRRLRDRLAVNHPQLHELSMGMSGDFEQAIEQGATMVRIGSALFE